MKKTIISIMALALCALAANAATYMYVRTIDGSEDRYEMEHVTEVYYEEVADAQKENGVSVNGKVDGYAYVDLLLPSGTKWATYNVGAGKPTEKGSSFAWGETSSKENYVLGTYEWCKLDSVGKPFYTKYGYVNGSSMHDGKYSVACESDMKFFLDMEDDAAIAQWGNNWRMPSWTELAELVDGCLWNWTADFEGSGVDGWVGTSKRNGNVIFLPVSDSFLGYWSSALSSSSPNRAMFIFTNDGSVNVGEGERHVGRAVRAVVAK